MCSRFSTFEVFAWLAVIGNPAYALDCNIPWAISFTPKTGLGDITPQYVNIKNDTMLSVGIQQASYQCGSGGCAAANIYALVTSNESQTPLVYALAENLQPSTHNTLNNSFIMDTVFR
jgi:hypothetical protein